MRGVDPYRQALIACDGRSRHTGCGVLCAMNMYKKQDTSFGDIGKQQ
jgi:hypothetical protein